MKRIVILENERRNPSMLEIGSPNPFYTKGRFKVLLNGERKFKGNLAMKFHHFDANKDSYRDYWEPKALHEDDGYIPESVKLFLGRH